MAVRLSVTLAEDEFSCIRRLARFDGVSVSEWVRRTLRAAVRERSSRRPAEKLAAMRELLKMNLPTCDIEQMIRESGW
jgi:hypothetical protein